MKRSNFLKSLIVSFISPKVVVEVAKGIDVVPAAPLVAKSLISKLQLLDQQYYVTLVEKYGTENFTTVMEQVRSNSLEASYNPFSHYEISNEQSLKQ